MTGWLAIYWFSDRKEATVGEVKTTTFFIDYTWRVAQGTQNRIVKNL